MISTSEALSRILSLLSPTDVETCALTEALGRVLAQTVCASRTQPPFSASAMDGYAVRRAEAEPGMTLKVIGESAAGHRFAGALGSGEAVRIFTGAPVPDGADDIVIQEDVTRVGDRITISPDRDQQRYIRPAGADFFQGDTFAGPKRLTPQDIALLAAMNIAEVPVYRKPDIALIATGDELVMPGGVPGPDQIISSNNLGLKALLEACGASCRLLPIAPDSADGLSSAFRLADGADLIVTLGGASVGDHDLVQEVAGTRGLDLDFYKVAMRPGKPLMAGRFGTSVLVGLPGNPVSAMVCGHIFLRPAVDALLGLPSGPITRKQAKLSHDIGENAKREHYMRASVTQSDDGPVCQIASRQDSALLSVLATANALAVRPPLDPARKEGDLIEFIDLSF